MATRLWLCILKHAGDSRYTRASPTFQSTTFRLRWLIECVDLTGLRGATIAGQILFLSVPGRGLPVEISTRICGLSREDGPPQCGWASSNPLRL